MLLAPSMSILSEVIEFDSKEDGGLDVSECEC